jgi:hypothetical protein
MVAFSHPQRGEGARSADEGSSSIIADRSIKIVRDTNALLPLRTRNLAAVLVNPHGDPLDIALRTLDAHATLEAADVLVLLLALRPKSGAGAIAVPEPIRELARRYAHKTLAISFGSPYVLAELGDVSTFVCAWGVQPVMQIAAMRAIGAP